MKEQRDGGKTKLEGASKKKDAGVHEVSAIIDHDIRSEKYAKLKIRWVAGDVTKEPLQCITAANSGLLHDYVKKRKFTRKTNPVPLPYMITEYLRSISNQS